MRAGSLWVTQGFQTLRRIDPEHGRACCTRGRCSAPRTSTVGDGAVFVASPPQGARRANRSGPTTSRRGRRKLHPWLDRTGGGGRLRCGWRTNSDPTLFKFDLATGHQLKARSLPARRTARICRMATAPCGWRTRAAAPSPASILATERTRSFPVGHAAGRAARGRLTGCGVGTDAQPSVNDELQGVTGKVATAVAARGLAGRSVGSGRHAGSKSASSSSTPPRRSSTTTPTPRTPPPALPVPEVAAGDAAAVRPTAAPSPSASDRLPVLAAVRASR